MIQVVLKNGIKKRFTNKIVGVDPNDIDYQKVLTKDEEEKKIVNNNGEWEYEKTIPGKDINYLKKKIMSFQTTIDAGNKHDFDMSNEEAELQHFKDLLASQQEK